MKKKDRPVNNRSLPGNESLLRQLWRDPMGRAGMIGVGVVILLYVLVRKKRGRNQCFTFN